MKNLINTLLLTPLCLFALSAQADIENYSFHSPAGHSTFEFPGLFLGGETKGKLSLEKNSPNDYPPSNSEFDIKKLSLRFETAPELVATNFSFNPSTGTYLATVNNAWVFKAVNVEVFDIRLEESQQRFFYRVSVPTFKNLTNTTLPSPSNDQPILIETEGFLVNQTPFKVVDAINVMIEGKRLSIKLNGNLSSNNNPAKGMIGSGIELKLLWMGHGEKLLYIPAPFGVKPVAIVLNSFNIGDEPNYDFAVRFEDNGSIIETPFEPLMPRLQELFPQF